MFSSILNGAKSEQRAGPDLAGAALREPIFYGGESAYGFQYRDLAEKKYKADDPWLLSRMGFSISDARTEVARLRTCWIGKSALRNGPCSHCRASSGLCCRASCSPRQKWRSSEAWRSARSSACSTPSRYRQTTRTQHSHRFMPTMQPEARLCYGVRLANTSCSSSTACSRPCTSRLSSG